MQKNTMNMIAAIFTAAALSIACVPESNPTYTPPAGDTGNGVAGEPDRTAFALGADISWYTRLVKEGEKFYNAAGEERECTALMKEIGMNSIRLRVWVDPEDGWCNKGDVLFKAYRAQQLGMRIMIDFHYSDTWADPAKQVVPAAWLDYDNDQLAEAVSQHTTDVLSTLKDAGVEVEWVQVGNETTRGMLIHSSIGDDGYGIELEGGRGGAISSHPDVYAEFTNAGYDAVKSVYPDAKVIVHIDGGHDISRVSPAFNALEANGGKYDIIGLSIYPGGYMERIESCVSNISTLSERYGKKVMICEVGMAYDKPEEAYEQLSALLKGAEATGQCLGVFYWEPEAPAGYNSGYTMGAFADGAPTKALDAFTEMAASEKEDN